MLKAHGEGEAALEHLLRVPVRRQIVLHSSGAEYDEEEAHARNQTAKAGTHRSARLGGLDGLERNRRQPQIVKHALCEQE